MFSTALGGAVALPTNARASVYPTPSVQIAKGTLSSPSAVAGWSNEVQDGLCLAFYGSPDICPVGGRPRAPEIKALARALKNDPDLIFEFVRDSVDTEFIFGAHKGALGASIDRSGSSFDQAMLLYELLREAGITARYQFGTVTLTASQFYDWTGMDNAQAACALLAAGGIPAVINGETRANCDYTGAVSSVTVSHVWVEAQIGGVYYTFDPSLKAYAHQAGMGVSQAMGLSDGELWTAATSGMTQQTAGGVPYASNLNQEALASKLQQYSMTLETALKAKVEAGKDLTDVIGGRRLKPVERPAGGWRLARPANYSATMAPWDGIPTPFRNKLILDSVVPTTSGQTASLLNLGFFTDEIYGRRLELGSRPEGDAATAIRWIPMVTLDGVELQAGPSVPFGGNMTIGLSLDINHPFVGDYGDVSLFKQVDIFTPAAVVHGWGRTSSRLLEKWEDEQAYDKAGYTTLISPLSDVAPQAASSGDLLRSKIAAKWLAESSVVGAFVSQMANSRFAPLHSVGVVSADQINVPVIPQPRDYEGLRTSGFVTYDEVAIVDVESSFGVVSRVSDEVSRRAALHTIAAIDAALEGGVVTQLVDTPDAASTASRMAWGNRPEATETPNTTPRRFYSFGAGNSLTSNAIKDLAVYDGGTTTVPAFNNVPEINQAEVDGRRTALADAIKNYTSLGYEVVSSAEASLGPGHRIGTEYATWEVKMQNESFVLHSTKVFYCAPPRPTSSLIKNWPETLDSSIPMDGSDEAVPCTGTFDLEDIVDYVEVMSDSIESEHERTITGYKRSPTLQRGGALIATKYHTSTGEPLAIAHALTRVGMVTKGGGAPSTSVFDMKKVSEGLNDRFKDRSGAVGVNLATGLAGFSGPIEGSVGQGEFPYKLEQYTELRNGYREPPEYITSSSTTPYKEPDGPVSIWQNTASIGSSVGEALGLGRVDAAAQSLAALAAMQSIWRQPRAPAREAAGALVADWWSKSWRHNMVTLSRGAGSERFVRLASGGYAPVGGGAGSVSVTGAPNLVRPPIIRSGTTIGATQREATTRAWRYDGMSVTAKSANGDVRNYGYWGVKPNIVGPPADVAALPDTLHGFRLTTWTFPRGVTLTLDYAAANANYPSVGAYFPYGGMDTPLSVTSSLGQTLSTLTRWEPNTWKILDAAGKPTRLALRPVVARTLTQRPDPNRRVEAVYGALDDVTPMLSYGYDMVGRVAWAKDRLAAGGQRQAHNFYIADGYRGERVDPLGNRYAVETTSAGGLSVDGIAVASRTRHIDELSRVTTSLMDGRGRVLSRTYPEGDADVFSYDGRDNVIKLAKHAKPGSSQVLTVEAAYDPVWNKPLWVKDAREQQTDFTYVPQGSAGAGEVATVTQPAVAGGRPVWTFEYGTGGLPTKATDPTGVVTRTDYDASGNPKATVLDPGGVNAQTCRTFDAAGNVTSERDPRAGACS
ncbi:hypothetical protein AS593_07165 [Caulobacter vibrioides]|nr:hypothetical protein AS593_07165 [Caulobacter vibrioides]